MTKKNTIFEKRKVILGYTDTFSLALHSARH